MQASRLQTAWVMTKTAGIMLYYCSQAIAKQLFGRINRKWVDKTTLHWSRQLLNAPKVDWKIDNPHRVMPPSGKATILMSNHASHYDIPLVAVCFPEHSIRMLAKKELSKVPFMGGAMLASGFPFIDRHNMRQAKKDLVKVKELLQDGITIWIAPEGTRTRTGELGQFKTGGFVTAIETGATIIPIGIQGSYQILPPGTWTFTLNQKVTLHIGQTIDASEYTLADRKELITRVKQSISNLLSSAQ